MKIVMLGNTNVGKTTYMASLYGIMQQKINGFSLKTESGHDNLLNLSRQISNGNYPGATSVRSEYNFNLQYQGNDTFNFTWADYRGGAIKDETNHQDVSLLMNSLSEADGIMMFCDCELLISGNFKAKNEIRRMTVLISQALQKIERPISLAIALTKFDRITHFSENIISPFSGIIDIINASEYVVGGFIPIACGTQFMNVPMPLLFALKTSVIWQAMVSKHLLEQHYNQSMAWQQKSQGVDGFFRWVGDKWSGATTDEEMAQKEMAQAVEMYQFFEFIKDPVMALNTYLDKIPNILPEHNLQYYAEGCTRLKFYHQVTNSRSSKAGWF